ncbi:MAG: tannase/feruloyl esterase family alpha/beta hydrolase, partial [Candidatus Sulfotelmatobacter sp.]
FDGGHSSRAGDSNSNALWGYNDLQTVFDFGVRAPHVAALAGKAITERFYGKPPAESYFAGCSSGGQQALSEAERFPWDFNGILSGAPSPTFSGPMMYFLWGGRALAGKVTQGDLRLVHEHALAMCDRDDGVKDGVIGDPLHCNVHLPDLLCKGAYKEGKCLTAEKIEEVRKVYSGPTTSKGVKIYTGGPLPGSELNWINDGRSGRFDAYVNDAGKVAGWSGEYFRYIGFMPAPGPSWKAADFDFDRDYKRFGMAEELMGYADNPDLRKFKAAGGKMILYQGGADQSDIPTDAIDYYDTAEKTMGGRASTQDFFRLFLIPGMNHCLGGEGAWSIDYLSYLEDWVERGKAPAVMIGSHLDLGPFWRAHSSEPDFFEQIERFRKDPRNVKFTRAIYPYPVRAVYRGKGDPNRASNWAPVGR